MLVFEQLGEMWKLKVVLFLSAIGATLSSTLRESTEEANRSLERKLNRMEERLLSSVSRKASDLVQEAKKELLGAVEDAEKRFLSEQNRLTEKVKKVETACRDRQIDFSVKLSELEQKTSERKEDVDKRLLRVEAALDDATIKLQNVQKGVLMIDDPRLKQVEGRSVATLTKVLSVEREVKNVLDRERSKIEILEMKENLTRMLLTSHMSSQLDVEKAIRKDIKSSIDSLRGHINESLTAFEKRQSDFKVKMRNLETSISRFQRVYASIRRVSSLEENLQSDLKSIRDEVYPRLKQLEDRGDMRNDVSQIKESLKNHSSEIIAMTTNLFDIQNSCPAPPSIENGYPVTGTALSDRKHGGTVTYACQADSSMEGNGEMFCRLKRWRGSPPVCTKKQCTGQPPSLPKGKATNFERKHGSYVQYECDENFVMTRNSTVHCESGQWRGHPPTCNAGYFDKTFYGTFYYDGTLWVMRCYRNTNSQKIEFSRMLDDGSVGSLLANTTLRTFDESVGIDIATDIYDAISVYDCGFKDGEGSMDIFLPLQFRHTLYFQDSFMSVSSEDPVRLQLSSSRSDTVQWRHQGRSVPSWDGKTELEINRAKTTDAGVYRVEYGAAARVVALLRLIVRKCKANFYGKYCEKECAPCYNGGICHDLLGICVCPEGFVGRNCERPCPESHHGADCSARCTRGDCKYQFLCKPDPYGCSCARGLKGMWCSEECDSGWYGADCKQQCHCAKSSESCNRVTGSCSEGCAPGWKGESCQIRDPTTD